MEPLLDVDRWDRAGEDVQDATIAAVARLVAADFAYLRTETFTATQRRVELKTCEHCNGWGGVQPQSGSEFPDCGWCDNKHEIEHPYASSPLAHRVAVFRHRTSAAELVLVPGRLDIAACLVGRAPHAGEPPPGLRLLAKAETRHACLRGGAFALEWEQGTWPDAHPFGLAAGDARLACTIPALAAAQGDAYHALAAEVGPLEPGAGAYVRTGYGTADPPPGGSTAAFSLDGRWLATAALDVITVWDAANGRQLSRFALAAPSHVVTLSFAPDHLRLVASGPALVEIFEIATGESLLQLGAGKPEHRCARWLPDGRLLVAEAKRASREIEATLALVDPETGATLQSAAWTQTDFLFTLALAVSGDGKRAASSIRYENALAIWDLDRWEIVERCALDDRTNHVAFAGDRLVTSSRDRVIAFAPEERLGGSRYAQLDANGTRVAWTTVGGVCVHDLATGASCLLPAARIPIAFAPDGRVATGLDDHRFTAIWYRPPLDE